MAEKRTLEEVLSDLKEAEKEYKEKCLKYGIIEKQKRKKEESNDTNEDQTENEKDISEEATIESGDNNEETISEN